MSTDSYNIPQQVTSVRLASTSNISGTYFNGNLNNGVGATLTEIGNGSLVVDGISVNSGDRILLPLQTNSNQNGIYTVNAVGDSQSPWILQRSPDYQSLEQLKLGQFFSVNAGSTLAGNMFVLVEPLPYCIGCSGLNFVDVTTGGSSGGGPFLRIANNLSDLSSLNTSYNNFGLGAGDKITLTDVDFVGGNYFLSNPCPNLIVLNCTISPATLHMPSAQGSDAFGLYQGPQIVNMGTQRINIVSFLGIPQTPSLPADNKKYILTDNGTTGGTWDAQGFVTDILGQTGSVSLLAGANMDITPNNDGTITLSALSGPSAVTSGQANFYTTNVGAPRTTFSGTGVATPIIVGLVQVLNQTNFDITQSSGTPNVQFLTTATRQVLINAVLTLNTSSAFSQSFSIYVAKKNGIMTTLTNAIATITTTPTSSTQEISLTINLALTGPGDNIQFWISNNSATTDPVNVLQCYCTILDTTQFGGFSSTDVLPQGVNNLYLSQNGGSTYQNVNGLPVTVNDIVSFNTTGGQLKDSGVAVSSLILPSTALGGSLSGFLPNPSISALGVSQVVAITSVSVTSYSMSDQAPINRYVLSNSSLCTLTLPVTASMTVGHTISIMGGTSAVFKIAQNAGQSIQTSVVGSPASTTPGVAGFAQTSNPTDCIELVYNGGGVFIIANEQTSGAGIVLN